MAGACCKISASWVIVALTTGTVSEGVAEVSSTVAGQTTLRG